MTGCGCVSENHRFGCIREVLPIPPTTSAIIWPHQGNRYDHARHCHSAIEMNVVVRGRGSYEVDGRRHPLVPGTVLWIRPGEVHYVEERSDDFFMWIVAAEQTLFEDTPSPGVFATLFPVGASSGVSRVLDSSDFAWLEGEIRRTFERDSADMLRAGVRYAVLGALESRSRTSEITPGMVLSAPLAKALELLKVDPSWSRERLAEEVGTSPERLGRLFRSEIQVSFVTYRNRIRLQKFLEIRRLGRGTLLGACLEAGFGSYAQFHRVFTDAMGAAPSRDLSASAEAFF